MIGLSRIERAISDAPKGGMRTGDPKVTLKLCDAQRIKAELEHLTALSTQVESLLDDRKAFVKKEFQLLKEIERLEIELKKRDEQNAALAAQVEALLKSETELQALTEELLDHLRYNKRESTDVLESYWNRLEQIPSPHISTQQHLRDVRAEAGRAGFVAGATDAAAYIAKQLQSGATDINLELAPPADKYAERVKDGEK